MLGEFHFLRPIWLLALPAVIWLGWRMRQFDDPNRGWRGLLEPALLNAFSVGTPGSGKAWKFALQLASWMSLVFVLAGPTWSLVPSPFNDEPLPAVILFNASSSMDTSDLQPSRLERAKLKVVDLVAELKGQPLGLVAFAGTAHLVLPPTKDAAIVGQMASELSSQIMPVDGNQFAEAVRVAVGTLPEGAGTLVAISDRAPSKVETKLPAGVNLVWLPVAGNDAGASDRISKFCSRNGASLVPLTPDRKDVDSISQIVRRAQGTPKAGSDARWSEAGWWLLPVVALGLLAGYRRETDGMARQNANQ